MDDNDKCNNKDILEDIYISQIENLDKIILDKKSEIKNLIDFDEDKLQEIINSSFNEEQKNIIKNIFYEVEEKDNIKLSEYSKEFYKQGFKDGIRLIIDCLKDK